MCPQHHPKLDLHHTVNNCLVHRGLLYIIAVVFVRKVAVIVRPSALASNKDRHDTDPDEVKTEKHPTETHGTLENDRQPISTKRERQVMPTLRTPQRSLLSASSRLQY